MGDKRCLQEVWQRPIGQIARDWNINSARLRAACKELCVPLPAAGHWSAARGENAPQAPPLPAYEGASTLILDKRPRESLVQWMKRGDTQPRYVPLSVWATAVFGEHVPHKNTLLRWVHDGRIQPQPKKMGRTWWVRPEAEYVGD